MWLVNYKIMWLDLYIAMKFNLTQAGYKTKYYVYYYIHNNMVILGHSLASYLKEISIRWALAAVVVSLLKFSQSFRTINLFYFIYCIKPRVFLLLSNILSSLSFLYRTFISNFFALNIEQFEKELSIVWFAFCLHSQ